MCSCLSLLVAVMSPNLKTSFWERMGLRESDGVECVRAVEEVYGTGYTVKEFESQGYCSFTMVVSRTQRKEGGKEVPGSTIRMRGRSSIVQIRPPQHSLDLAIAHAARKTYGDLAPIVRCRGCEMPGGLKAFEMDLLNGTPFSRLQPRSQHLDPQTLRKQANLIESLASLIAQAWPSSGTSPPSPPRHLRADSPVSDDPAWLAQCTGKVGANLVPKLEKLVCELPDRGLRARAKRTLDGMREIREYPVVINHGDLIASNVLVDHETWGITGLVDWAEAEWLPFGTCLYGLDQLLGFLTSRCEESPCREPTFTFYDDVEALRSVFWERLVKERPDVEARLKDVRIMRDVGVLLWLGYAWDEGRIDRVVNEVDDAEELVCLRAFLGV